MKRTSIRVRLMVMMIILTTLPVMTVTWFATSNTRKSVEKEIINANVSRMMWADQYLNELIEQLYSLFYSLQINHQLIDGINGADNPDPSAQFITQNYIKTTLVSAFYANSRKIDELNLYMHSNKKAVVVNFPNSGLIYSLDINEGAWNRMLKEPVSLYFKQLGKNIYAFHSINEFEDKRLIGGISVKLNKDVWKEVSNILKSESESTVFLLNDEGEMLSGSSNTEESSEFLSVIRNIKLEGNELKIHATKDYFYFIKKIYDGKITVVKAIPLTEVNKSARATVNAGIFTGILFAIISVILSILVSFRISSPIVSLAKNLKMSQNKSFQIKSEQSSDEIDLLEHSYNSMMNKIKELLEDEYKKNIELKNAQLRALQAQINPHFLNNALNLMGGMALSKGAPEIYQVARAIGDLLRYAISNDGDMVMLKDEVAHMQNYMFVQEKRFQGRVTSDLYTSEEVLDIRLPKFILQPVVENAFEHGLQKKQGEWYMNIRIKKIKDRVVIMIKDNGIGVDPERLNQVRNDLRSGIPISEEKQEADVPKKRKGIGLRNVNARLRLQYGNGYGARIFSRQGAGTLVVLVLPA